MNRADEESRQAGFSLKNLSALDRRAFLRLGGAVGLGAMLAGCKEDSIPPKSAASQPASASAASTMPSRPEMVRFPEKTDLILLTDRPPQLETPIKYFREDLTPNEAFFVRWHLAGVPTSVDTKTFRLAVHGHVEQELSLSLDDLRQQFEPVSVVAVNQCSGNSRALFEPRVPGGQWQNGAIGNAQWTGVRLKDVLDKAKVKPGPVEVSFQGLDRPVFPATPAFIKSLGFEHANDGEVMIAYEMNNQPLPLLNGFPIRLIVPGWYATYWVKALNDINVLSEPFKGFWMDKAYRVAVAPNLSESPDHLAEKTVPINAMTVRSLIVRPEAGDHLPANQAYEIEGVALDAGKGITKVEVSTDGGKTWADSQLDPEIGRYSWRRFRFKWTPASTGPQQLMSRATNAAGETQATQQWNRSGYARDVIDPIDVTVA
jgi:DMSO/TMAO reductase YedYZ molybdopterin-dependent catalytic subunit